MRPDLTFVLAIWLTEESLSAAAALSPEHERASFHLADPDLVIERVASEPEVLSPVALAWDANGRLYVAEMRDYPNGNTAGAIRRLEDRDGDGRYETAVVFADDLPFPTSVLPWRDGLLVTAAPDIWFLRDRDGDGHAEERVRLFSGFGLGNQQLRVNGLYWGLDNWVYGANGRSDGLIRSSRRTNAVSLSGRDFRFRPGTGEFETLAGRSQFGLARNDWGQRFLSWNTIPVRHEVFPDRYFDAASASELPEVVLDLLPAEDASEVFPLTPAPVVFNNESASNFNALAGLTLYRGDALGSNYYGNAFVGESLRNLVHRRILEPSGVTYRAKRGEEKSEFLASTDPWFHPVNFATGPDGALYVVDFYREFVEHPDWVAKEMRTQVDWRVGSEHGRLWRIARQKGSLASLNSSRNSRPAEFVLPGTNSVVSWLKLLESPNAWQRDTAQRLLFERQDPAIVPELKRAVSNSARPEARVIALNLLAGFGALDEQTILTGLRDAEARVREQSLELVGEWLLPPEVKHPVVALPAESSGIDRETPPIRSASTGLRAALEARVSDSDPRVQVQLALAARVLEIGGRVELLARLIPTLGTNRWLRLAIESALGSASRELVEHLFGDLEASNRSVRSGRTPEASAVSSNGSVPVSPGWLEHASDEQLTLLEHLGERLAKVPSPGFAVQLAQYQSSFLESTNWVHPSKNSPTNSSPVRAAAWHAFVSGLAAPTRVTNSYVREIERELALTNPRAAQQLRDTLDEIVRLDGSSHSSGFDRMLAIRLLQGLSRTEELRVLLYDDSKRSDLGGAKRWVGVRLPATALPHPVSSPVRVAAANAFLSVASSNQLAEVFEEWHWLTSDVRHTIAMFAAQRPTGSAALLKCLTDGKLSVGDIPAAALVPLERSLSEAGRQQLTQLRLAADPFGRNGALERARPALALTGDGKHGASIINRLCLGCHYLGGHGQRVGPDLSGASSRSRDALLVDIIDPNRQVAPDYVAYSLLTTDGESITGLLQGSNENVVRLRRPGVPDETLLRSRIQELESTERSLMPEGLEVGLELQEIADLLEFLTHPEQRWLEANP